MATTLMTPGVYIEEKSAFPNPATAVPTAVPAFIGYTGIAARNGKSLVRQPVRITSFAEYVAFFGTGFKPKYKVTDAAAADRDAIVINGAKKILKIIDHHTFYLYNSIRLFYANGGNTAYVISLGTYDDKPEGFKINMADFTGSKDAKGALDILSSEAEPTLVVIPDAIALGEDCYNNVYKAVLQHCAKMQNRFGIFDLVKQSAAATTADVAAAFRNKIGTDALSYGAAYYPWLQTTIVQPDEIDFENFDTSVNMGTLLPEDAAKEAVTRFKAIKNPTPNDKKNYHLALKATSLTYVHLLNELRYKENELPPCGAIAGIYTLVDSTRGVWKAPANIVLNMVNAPTVNISNEMQEQLNEDGGSGKSINVIRTFPGAGTLVWGGRTLDGNSQDWRYINIRRTMIMIEQSVKLACRAYISEPNDAHTWITVKSMIEDFLTSLWKEGALAGSSPVDAFNVEIGLGSTMTSEDVLDSRMVIAVKVAVARPYEFIAFTFNQQMQ